MREKKFRWFDKRQNKMRYDLVSEVFPDGSVGCVLDSEHCEGPFEYTGINDSTGKEIYDGDIIKENFGRWYIVFWKQDECSFWMHKYGGDGGAYSDEIWPLTEAVNSHDNKSMLCEIIGNIYENPELLT